MREPVYQVVWPLGKSAYEILPVADIASSLGGKTVCELWDWAFRGQEMFAVIRETLKQRFPDIRFVDYDKFGNILGRNDAEVIAALPALLRQHGCDAVISAVGA